MANRPQLTSFLFPILIPTLAFFLAYFLFPSFSKDFFGVSAKGNNLEVSSYSRDTKASSEKNQEQPSNVRMIEDIVFIPNAEPQTTIETETPIPADVKTIKNPEFDKRGK